jgi:hypothetical protein
MPRAGSGKCGSIPTLRSDRPVHRHRRAPMKLCGEFVDSKGMLLLPAEIAPGASGTSENQPGATCRSRAGRFLCCAGAPFLRLVPCKRSVHNEALRGSTNVIKRVAGYQGQSRFA